MEKLNNLVLDLGGNAWNLVLVLAIFLGVFYGIRTKFIQIRLFPEALRLVKNRAKEGKDEKGVSSFQALCITLGGCIGTGNVAGVAMAIVVGGPGAVFWMWLIAILGMVTSFMENTLAQVYKVQEGEVYRGGPSYYMEKGLGKRWLGILYAFSMIVSLGFALAALQSNTISLSVGQALGIPALVTSILVAVLIALVIFGGVRRIAKVAERGVPIMTLVYFALALLVLIVNIQKVPEMFALIFSRAFDFKAVGGAAIGTVIYQGLKRGVFSNGAGQGDAPTAGASAEVSHPAKQGLFGVFSVFIDTILVCTLTAFVIIISGVHEYSDRVGIELSQLAFSSSLGKWAGVVLMLCIFMFCFTSIMSNYYCGESCLAFMAKGMKGRNTYRIIFVTAIFLGGITGVDLMWNIADLNMISLIFLGKKAIKVADDYIRQKKEGKDPVFCSKGIKGLEGAECWGRER